MTLILAMANRDAIYVMGDRQLTSGGGRKVEDADCAKVGAMFACDGCCAFGFSGLARIASPKREMRRTILDLLGDSLAPDFITQNALYRFSLKLREHFQTERDLRSIPRQQRSLSILFAWFHRGGVAPLIRVAIVSNAVDEASGMPLASPIDHFAFRVLEERQPIEDVGFVKWIPLVVSRADTDALTKYLAQRRKPHEILGRAIGVITQASRRHGLLIGRQMSWIQVFADPSRQPETGYRVDRPTKTVFMPSVVFSSPPEGAVMADEPQMSTTDGSFIAVPRVKGRRPCLCGSGKRYRDCHGQKIEGAIEGASMVMSFDATGGTARHGAP